MGLLPDIVNGQLIETAEDKQFKRFTDSHDYKEKRRKLAESMAKIKAKHAVKEVKEGDKNLGELNNEGHNLITEDFSDSPHADREEEKEESDSEEESDDDSVSGETE